MYSNEEIKKCIEEFLQDRSVGHRYASYDICYSYFKSNSKQLTGDNLQMSCLQLWSYLASWGMLRNSNLLYKSPHYFIPLIYHINEKYEQLSKIDVDNYTEENIKLLCQEYEQIQNILEKNGVSGTKTLITKIMMGVYGNVPTFDVAFSKTFKGKCTSNKVNKDNLEFIKEFYDNHIYIFEEYKVKVFDFYGNDTNYIYSKAKLIDMFSFIKNGKEENKNKE